MFEGENNPETEKKKYLLKKMYTYREKFYSFWNNLKQGGSMELR